MATRQYACRIRRKSAADVLQMKFGILRLAFPRGRRPLLLRGAWCWHLCLLFLRYSVLATQPAVRRPAKAGEKKLPGGRLPLTEICFCDG